nr:unnamed protein product [Callosobruchus analis]
MDPLYIITEDGRLSPLSYDSTQSTLIFSDQQLPVQVGNVLLHEVKNDLAALAKESDNDTASEVEGEELVDGVAANGGVAENAWLPQEVADEEQSNDLAYFSSV